MWEALHQKEFRRIFNGTYYGKKYEQLTVASLEEFYNYILSQHTGTGSTHDPYSVAVIYSYLYHKEHEVNCLTIALECVRYGGPRTIPALYYATVNKPGGSNVIEKMPLLSITIPKADIDRVVNTYLCK